MQRVLMLVLFAACGRPTEPNLEVRTLPVAETVMVVEPRTSCEQQGGVWVERGRLVLVRDARGNLVERAEPVCIHVLSGS